MCVAFHMGDAFEGIATPVVCLAFSAQHLVSCRLGVFQPAYVGLRVAKSPSFPTGEEAGRVGPGVGTVTKVELGNGNIEVLWHEVGDITLWTRAGEHGFDVVSLKCPREGSCSTSSPLT